MPRSNWKGSISFGLVNIPIVLFNSEEPGGTVAFKQINRKTGNKIKYKRLDAETEKEVPWEEIGKGYQYSKDVVLPVEEGELKRVAGENARTIAIEEFIDKKNIDFIDIEKTYYLMPDKKGEKGYVILREALTQTNKVGIAKVIISTKEYLAAIGIYQNALVLYLLRYAEEIRPLTEFDVPDEDIKKYKVTAKEIEVAKKLIDSMSIKKWNRNQFKDEYKEAVEKWVAAKVNNLPESKMKSRMPKGASTGKMIDFMTLLKESLKHSKPVKKTSHKSYKPNRTKPSVKPRHAVRH